MPGAEKPATVSADPTGIYQLDSPSENASSEKCHYFVC